MFVGGTYVNAEWITQCAIFDPEVGSSVGEAGLTRVEYESCEQEIRDLAQQISKAFGLNINKDVVRRVLAIHCRPMRSGDGPSWLTFLGLAYWYSLEPVQRVLFVGPKGGPAQCADARPQIENQGNP